MTLPLKPIVVSTVWPAALLFAATNFPAFTVRYVFPLTHVFPRLSTVEYVSRACRPLHLFPRLPPVTSLPAIAACYIFSRACRPLNLFPRLPPVTSLPELAARYISSRACHPLHLFPRLPSVTSFPALSCRSLQVLHQAFIGKK